MKIVSPAKWKYNWDKIHGVDIKDERHVWRLQKHYIAMIDIFGDEDSWINTHTFISLEGVVCEAYLCVTHALVCKKEHPFVKYYEVKNHV